jgi:D-aspartate ligase
MPVDPRGDLSAQGGAMSAEPAAAWTTPVSVPAVGPVEKPPILLTMPNYGGTLAAARCLGERGIPVAVAGDEFLAPARWSRHTRRWLKCPPVGEADAFLDWLLDFGRREPGHVLYPTSDDTAFLFAGNAAALTKHFRMYQPGVDVLVRLLDKKLLWGACREAGLDTVPTWFPEGENELEIVAREASFPVLIKARTQVRRAWQNKGIVVRSGDELLPSYRAFVAGDRYLDGLEPHFRGVTRPTVQQFCAEAASAVHSVTGFIDRTGERFAARASSKVLQRTRPVGLGLCFEAVPLDPALAQAVQRLCRRVGYFGVFEVEFLCQGDKRMAIDFNPRFYGQMGFDARRGLPLPWFAWLAAAGREDELGTAVDAAAVAPDGPASIYCHRLIFELLLLAEGLAGRMPADERRRWKQWYADHRAGAVDASADRRDWLPGLVHSAAELWAGARALPRVLLQH